MITKAQAEVLQHGQIIYEIDSFNADGTPRRWRVNGKCKTWKTRPDDFRVPLKHGLYDYGYLDQLTANWLVLTEDEAYEASKNQ